MTLMRRVVLLDAFVLGTFAAAQKLATASTSGLETPLPALLILSQDRANRGLAMADPVTMKVVAGVPMALHAHKRLRGPNRACSHRNVSKGAFLK
jgi:hypothetical protein